VHNISFDYAQAVKYQREEGLRRAEKSGLAFEPRSRGGRQWPWHRERRDSTVRTREVAPAN
jgi:hypothetical protein